MKKILLAIVAVMLWATDARAQWDAETYGAIERSICEPVFSGKVCNVKKYGARPGKSAAENQSAINRAIAECSAKGGGRVVVPAGTYDTGAITLLSGVNLVVEKGATLHFVFQPELYPVVPTRWEGIDCNNLQPCIYAFKAKGIALTGEGVIDGGGTNDTWWKWCGAPRYGWREGMVSQRGSRPRLLKYAEDGVDADERVFGAEDGLRPQLVNFNQCENILIEGVTLLRSPFWVIHPLLCKNVTVRGVTIDNDGPNGDGCDPESCNGVLIENCTFNTGDDCIAVKSGRNNDGRLWDIPTQNVIIRHCHMANGHGGVVIGSEISGGCRNLFAHDCTMDSPELERVVRIKTNTCRGGVIENIYARDIAVGRCKEAVLKINLDYEHNELCCRGYLPTVRNINLDNVTCGSSRYGIDIIALDTCVNVYDVNVANCRFDNVADGNYRTGLVRDVRFRNFYINGEPCTEASISDEAQPIDRQRVVTRNNPVVSAYDPLSSLTVGNGHFAFTVDVTGLQTFAARSSAGVPLCTMSDWAWHSFPNTLDLKPEESRKTLDLHGRPSEYAVEYKEDGRGKAATEFFRVNPHRLNLGNIFLAFMGKNGLINDPAAITDVHQELKLWDGLIESRYKVEGSPVEVATGVLPDRDEVFSRIVSPLVAEGMVAVVVDFPYPTGRHSDDAVSAVPTDTSAIEIVEAAPRRAVVKRTIGSAEYFLTVQCEQGSFIDVNTADQTVWVMSESGDVMSFCAEFTPALPTDSYVYSYDQARKAVMKWWPRFWRSGAMADFSACTDPRASELERRVVLSQYLTQVNCAGDTPPQETGLTYNSWFGRPHLEMAWWHLLDFALWGRPGVVENILEWYDNVAYPEAEALAQRQGFDGVRWMKMTDPQAGEAPSNVGSFLIWQQPHYIYLAEEMYRANPTPQTLQRYARGVDATARFMADYARACDTSGTGPIELRGQTSMQESMSKDFSYAHPFEQAYWKYGLEAANRWRERLDLERVAEWDDLASRMAPLAEVDGIYTAGKQSAPNADFALKSHSDHPAVLGACGLLPDMGLYDREKMKATLSWVMDNWNWPTTWGWDYGMIAMAAARLGCPETAVDALLFDGGKNTYLVSGHNYQEPVRLRLYLPGNGALLDAVAMMCAGWDDSEGVNPGFPADGSWRVRWEGLKPMQ